MTNETKRILKEINELHRRLAELIEEEDISDHKVLKASQALDKLINDYYRHMEDTQSEKSFAEYGIERLH